LDRFTSKHILLPIGGSLVNEHNPGTFNGLINHLTGAMDEINDNGGIGGSPVRMGDEYIDVYSADAQRYKNSMPWLPLLLFDE